MPLRNCCQLITYPDSLGKNLSELKLILERCFKGALRGIHILPFFPSSGDRGFAPLRYDTVDPAFGSWADIQALTPEYDLIFDFMINHLSSQSAYFKEYLEQGEQSPYADLFFRLSQLAPGGAVTHQDLSKIYTRTGRSPFLPVQLQGGAADQVWRTFDDDQIDLNVFSPIGKKVVRQFLTELAAQHPRMIRVDSLAYVVKKLGSSCFLVEPDTSALLREIAEILRPLEIEVLPELHAPYEISLKLAAQGYYVYDFVLPILVLQALYSGRSQALADWLRICPRKQITTLDTHDGLPVMDVAGLMTPREVEETTTMLVARGAELHNYYSPDPENEQLEVYQADCTYYSALGNDDDSYLTARAIQFFTPGIPQVYYVGLLAGRNDSESVDSTQPPRHLNRRNYSLTEVLQESKRPAVQRLIRLMRFRNEYSAFDGKFTVKPAPQHKLLLEWEHGSRLAALEADLKTHRAEIHYRDPETNRVERFVV